MFCSFNASVCDQNYVDLEHYASGSATLCFCEPHSYALNYSNFTKLNLLLWAGVNHSTPGFFGQRALHIHCTHARAYHWQK